MSVGKQKKKKRSSRQPAMSGRALYSRVYTYTHSHSYNLQLTSIDKTEKEATNGQSAAEKLRNTQ